MADRLPVFRLTAARAGPDEIIGSARDLFGIDDFILEDRHDRVRLRAGSHAIEVASTGDSIWAADASRLWNPEAEVRALNEGDARERAAELNEQHRLTPKFDDAAPFRLRVEAGGGTFLALERGKRRSEHQLDSQVTYAVEVEVRSAGETRRFPCTGGGAERTLHLGDDGELVGYRGSWREPVGREFYVDVLPQEEVDRRFERLTANLRIDSVSRTIEYYAAPAFTAQEFMYPVYVYRITAVIDDRRIALRNVVMPATDFGPSWELVEAQPPLRRARSGLIESLELQPARGYLTWPFHPFESGASFIGTSGGLNGSAANARGFVDELNADGWTNNFYWGDANAWESDWHRNDDSWVDAADFVFYTGHADKGGWTLRKPDDTSLHHSEVGSKPGFPGDLWGQQDLEWVIIAACGPLQDDLISKGGGDVLARWDGAFDGLHLLMGYGAVTFDNTEEGRRVIQYAKEGDTLASAWFRTACEIQPSTNGWPAPNGPDVWVGVMWVASEGMASPIGDHLWGHGSVAPDPTSPYLKACMWTRT